MKLSGIEGSELWGFLAALGVLELMDRDGSSKAKPPALRFERDGFAFLESAATSPEELSGLLYQQLKKDSSLYVQTLGEVKKPVDIAPALIAKLAATGTRLELDAVAGLCCFNGIETVESSLCAANGAGHQNLVQSIRDILSLVEQEHIHAALFETWRRDFRVPPEVRKNLDLGNRKPTLRLDPGDERLYALRLENPTATDDFSTELGAQALALAGFSMIPVLPGKASICIASRKDRSKVYFHWALWSLPICKRAVRSLIALGVRDPGALRARGAFAAYRAARMSGAKGKLSFSPTEGVW